MNIQQILKSSLYPIEKIAVIMYPNTDDEVNLLAKKLENEGGQILTKYDESLAFKAILILSNQEITSHIIESINKV